MRNVSVVVLLTALAACSSERLRGTGGATGTGGPGGSTGTGGFVPNGGNIVLGTDAAVVGSGGAPGSQGFFDGGGTGGIVITTNPLPPADAGPEDRDGALCQPINTPCDDQHPCCEPEGLCGRQITPDGGFTGQRVCVYQIAI